MNSKPTDFLRPGHVNPLLAREGGVLRRAGHTEATVDLLKMAGLTPVGCLIEICSQRNTGMADVDELRTCRASSTFRCCRSPTSFSSAACGNG